jgi:DNA-directed RNA polymerase specialized sigma24 family protein
MTLKKHWTPSEASFRQLLNWLDEGADSGGERYLEMRRRLAAYFDRRNCLVPDELADETLNRVARRLEEQGCITDATPARYCYITAKFVLLEHLREPERGQASLDALSSHGLPLYGAGSKHPDATQESEQRLLDCLEVCLNKLQSDDRELILHYYHGEQREKIEHRRELAAGRGLTINALSIRACRIRNKVEACLRSCFEK